MRPSIIIINGEIRFNVGEYKTQGSEDASQHCVFLPDKWSLITIRSLEHWKGTNEPSVGKSKYWHLSVGVYQQYDCSAAV